MKVLGKTWFTPMGERRIIGIILVELTPEEMQEYDRDQPENAWIGMAVASMGPVEERHDIEHIMKKGARFPVAAARVAIFGE